VDIGTPTAAVLLSLGAAGLLQLTIEVIWRIPVQYRVSYSRW